LELPFDIHNLPFMKGQETFVNQGLKLDTVQHVMYDMFTDY